MSFCHCIRLALVALSAPLVVTAQDHPDVASAGNGARAAGLGFATTALANDLYSIGWNPAGLSLLTRPELGFTSRALIVITNANATDFTPTNFPSFTGAGEITGALDAVEFVGVAVPYRILGRTLTPGIAYRHFTEGVRVGTFETVRREANGRYKGSTKYQSTGGLRAISPSLGVEITRNLRVGATANILLGSTNFTLRPPAPSPAYRTRELDHAGLAIEAGVLYRMSDALQIGGLLTLPHDRTHRWDNDTTIRAVTRKAPLAVALGGVLALGPDRRVSADVRFSPWSSAEYLEDATGDAVASRVGVNDASSVHIGFERDREREIQNIYGVATGTRRTSQRAGLFVRSSTIADIKGKAIRAIGLSAGQSWILERAIVDLALSLSRSSQWTYSENTTLRMELHSNDFALSFGIRRKF